MEKEVTIKLTLPEHRVDLQMLIHADQLYSLLFDIDERCRSIIKHDSCSHDKIEFAQEIRNMINSANVLHISD